MTRRPRLPGPNATENRTSERRRSQVFAVLVLLLGMLGHSQAVLANERHSAPVDQGSDKPTPSDSDAKTEQPVPESQTRLEEQRDQTRDDIGKLKERIERLESGRGIFSASVTALTSPAPTDGRLAEAARKWVNRGGTARTKRRVKPTPCEEVVALRRATRELREVVTPSELLGPGLYLPLDNLDPEISAALSALSATLANLPGPLHDLPEVEIMSDCEEALANARDAVPTDLAPGQDAVAVEAALKKRVERHAQAQKQAVDAAMQGLITLVENLRERLASEQASLDGIITKIDAAKAQEKAERNQAAAVAKREAEQGVTQWTLTALPLFVLFVFVASLLFRDRVQEALFRDRTLVELVGASGVLMTLIVLATYDKIEEAAVAAVLGSIAGYIFGQQSKRSEGQPSLPQGPPEQPSQQPRPHEPSPQGGGGVGGAASALVTAGTDSATPISADRSQPATPPPPGASIPAKSTWLPGPWPWVLILVAAVLYAVAIAFSGAAGDLPEDQPRLWRISGPLAIFGILLAVGGTARTFRRAGPTALVTACFGVAAVAFSLARPEIALRGSQLLSSIATLLAAIGVAELAGRGLGVSARAVSVPHTHGQRRKASKRDRIFVVVLGDSTNGRWIGRGAAYDTAEAARALQSYDGTSNDYTTANWREVSREQKPGGLYNSTSGVTEQPTYIVELEFIGD